MIQTDLSKNIIKKEGIFYFVISLDDLNKVYPKLGQNEKIYFVNDVKIRTIKGVGSILKKLPEQKFLQLIEKLDSMCPKPKTEDIESNKPEGHNFVNHFKDRSRNNLTLDQETKQKIDERITQELSSTKPHKVILKKIKEKILQEFNIIVSIPYLSEQRNSFMAGKK